jgi:glucose-1-phosphate thymidylyltransferase
MKGIIIAGGSGTRLDPLTRITNKNLLPVYNKPLIYYPIELLRNSGISEIIIVSGKGHAGQFVEFLTSGKELGIKLSYAVQENPGGIAQALGLCKDFVKDEKSVVILGDNIFEDYDKIRESIENYESGAKIFLKKVHDPERFGVATVKDNKIIRIEEKPIRFESDLAVTGLYLYDSQVWEIIDSLKPSKRGELEITDVNNFYVNKNEMSYTELNGYWIDAGTFESMFKASMIMAKKSGFDLSCIKE